MAAIRGTNNAAEVAFRRRLWWLGLRYRLYAPDLPGKPDIVFRSAKVAVFVDGDFWHGRVLVERGESELRKQFRTKRREWWISKIKRNVERDARVNELLRAGGWRVVRLWEKDVLRTSDRLAARVAAVVRARSP